MLIAWRVSLIFEKTLKRHVYHPWEANLPVEQVDVSNKSTCACLNTYCLFRNSSVLRQKKEEDIRDRSIQEVL